MGQLAVEVSAKSLLLLRTSKLFLLISVNISFSGYFKLFSILRIIYKIYELFKYFNHKTCSYFRQPSEPRFLRKPTSTEAFEGDTIIIGCEVTGEPKPEVYWLRDFLKVNILIFLKLLYKSIL